MLITKLITLQGGTKQLVRRTLNYFSLGAATEILSLRTELNRCSLSGAITKFEEVWGELANKGHSFSEIERLQHLRSCSRG